MERKKKILNTLVKVEDIELKSYEIIINSNI